MKRINCYFALLVIIILPGIAFGQSAKDAFKALKKLEAKCQSGISYRDYGPALGDAKFEFNMFLESEEAKIKPELANSINKAMGHYIAAGTIWDTFLALTKGKRFSGSLLIFESGPGGYLVDQNEKDFANLLFKTYPNTAKKMEEGGAVMIIDEHVNGAAKYFKASPDIVKRMKNYGLDVTDKDIRSKYIHLGNMLSIIWTEASKELNMASRLLSK
jgi:hypothetical protein